VYSAAKAGITAATLVAAAEMGRYGVTANAIAPAARTRMTEGAFADMMAQPEAGAFDAMAPENVSPLVVWLGSEQSRDVTGRVFELEGGLIMVAEGWDRGPQIDKGDRWEPSELGPVVTDLLRSAQRPFPVHGT
jgi:NAD(P)-dependent dehydrogenase (short-subunit alcohol dehydrogenase family)